METLPFGRSFTFTTKLQIDLNAEARVSLSNSRGMGSEETNR
jgi:hypothetical protein